MEYSTEKEILQPILEYGLEGMSEVLQNLFNMAMRLERENALKASPYQRTEGRTGYANGFKERHIQSRVGELALQIPQTRNVDFIPVVLKEDYAAKGQSIWLWLRCIFKALPPDQSRTFLKNFADLKSVPCKSAVPRKCLTKNLKSGATAQSERL